MADTILGLKEILDSLKANPIFRMSLGSKELFHSNFLEFLWDLDNSKFIEVINTLLSNGKRIVLNPGIEYFFDREKENFDICIHHRENRILKYGNLGGVLQPHHRSAEIVVYDLIIENKVKSIPRKDQLEEYEEKAKGKGDTVFLLLSLVKDFPCRKELNKISPWIVAHYDDLKEAIKNHYKDVSEHSRQYINDYCQFIEQMHNLQDYMIRDFDKQVYYDEGEIKAYKDLRIHDLYIKLRGSMFITRLKEKLEKEKTGAMIHILPFNIKDNKNGKNKSRSFKYDDIRPFCNKNGGVHVFLDCTIQQGSGMIAAYVYKERNCDYIYEIVIQGNQYRHGINSKVKSDITITSLKPDCSEDEKEEAKKLQKLWKAMSDYDSNFFQVIHNCTKTCPENHYNKYAPEYVYKYVKLKENEIVEDLIDAFAEDIKGVVSKLNK